jgi:hypothetical protein
MSESALAKKLAAALASREDRNIRHRLPNPFLSLSPSIPRTISDVTTTVAAAATTTFSPSLRPHVTPVGSFSNYLALSTFPLLPARVLAALHSALANITSGCSLLLVYNRVHAALGARLALGRSDPLCPPLQLRFRRQHGFLRVRTAVG